MAIEQAIPLISYQSRFPSLKILMTTSIPSPTPCCKFPCQYLNVSGDKKGLPLSSFGDNSEEGIVVQHPPFSIWR